MVAWESLLERDAILLFEFSSGVVSYQEQPELITYYINGEPFSYYPDFELILSSGEILHVEVKPYAKLKKKKLQEKMNAIELHYKGAGRHLFLLTDREIRLEPRLPTFQVLRNVLNQPAGDEIGGE